MNPSVLILKRDLTSQGGAEKYARQIAHAFHKKGARVTFLTSGPVTETFPYEVLTMPQPAPTSLGTIWAFDHFCEKMRKAYSPDIVFGLDRNSFQTHLRASSGTHRAYLTYRKHEEPWWKSLRHKINPLHQLILHLEKKAFERKELALLFTNSHLVKREILSHYSIDEKKISVIHNGVEWNEWQKMFDDWPHQYRGRRYEFLFIGHNFIRKGLDRLLQGLSLLPSIDFHLSVVGEDKNRQTFVHLAKTLGLEKQVTFYGPQKNVIPFYQNADCLIIPSLYDPFANVTIEALAMGLFVISSKTNGGSEILTPETGCIIEELDDIQAVTEALTMALKNPKNKESALKIRESVQSMDFSIQLSQYLEQTLCSLS